LWLLLHQLLCLALKVLPATKERRLKELGLEATFHQGDGNALQHIFGTLVEDDQVLER
jgi:hypothetical protein